MKNKRALTVMAIAVLFGFVAVVFASRWLLKQPGGSNGRILVAASDISLGQRLTPEMFKPTDWPEESMPKGAFTDPQKLAGRVLKTNLLMGEPVSEAKLAPSGTLGGLSALISEGRRAITVRVNDVIGVAGFALPGNYVDILVNLQGGTLDNGARQEAISKIVLERILVLAVAQDAGREDTKARVVNAVTLELTPDQVEKLDLARSIGSLSLVLRNQVDPQPANTGGATRASVLGLPAPAPAAPPSAPSVPAEPAPAPARPAAPAAPAKLRADGVLVIRGLDAAPQAFN